MNELTEITVLRAELQDNYLESVQEIWNSNLEPVRKDSRARKLYKEYKHKDLFLEKIEANLESVLADINYYKENMK